MALFVLAEVDGVEEEGTPMDAIRTDASATTYAATSGNALRTHSHVMAGADLHRGTYTGQFGFLMIDPANTPGNFDKEVFLALRRMGTHSSILKKRTMTPAPPARSPSVPRRWTPVHQASRSATRCSRLNAESLGAGEPIRVNQGDCVPMPSPERQRQHEPEHSVAGPSFPNRGIGRESRSSRRRPWMSFTWGRASVLTPLSK